MATKYILTGKYNIKKAICILLKLMQLCHRQTAAYNTPVVYQ